MSDLTNVQPLTESNIDSVLALFLGDDGDEWTEWTEEDLSLPAQPASNQDNDYSLPD